MHFERMGRAMDEYLVRSEVPQQPAEARMVMGGGSPVEFVSILRMQHSRLPENEKSLVLASIHGKLAFGAVASQMRRLFGSCGSEASQDVFGCCGRGPVLGGWG